MSFSSWRYAGPTCKTRSFLNGRKMAVDFRRVYLNAKNFSGDVVDNDVGVLHGTDISG